MYKIFIPKITCKGEYLNLLLAGCQDNKNVILTSSIEDCDYVFLDFRHHKKISNLIDYLDKTVMIDFRDNPNDVFKEKFMLYFKRSVVNKMSSTFINYNKKIIPISYSLKSYFL